MARECEKAVQVGREAGLGSPGREEGAKVFPEEVESREAIEGKPQKASVCVWCEHIYIYVLHSLSAKDI